MHNLEQLLINKESLLYDKNYQWAYTYTCVCYETEWR
jgi:hypothetical protein